MMQIHERIKSEREKLGITPGELAKKLGVPRTTYLHWETSTPNPDKVVSVAKALGLSEYYFFIPEKTNQADEIADIKPADNIDTQEVEGSASENGLSPYERIIEEKEARRQETKEWAERAEREKDRYLRIIEENLTQLLKVTLTITANLTEVKQDTSLGLSYQRAWVEYTAEEVAQGDKKKKDQNVLRMGRLLKSQIEKDRKEGNRAGVHKQSKDDN